ncbi:hypothetical protein [Pseudonocardia xishanensis]|uniref:Basic proline-rich protein n=1 Tax=Pseudonocardia xishanensis TaxID=630995 RepID=A0ABP8RF26_9PSEU
MAHTHHLLLSLAGRVDDDLLATARELVAVGEEPQALELLVATLIADRTTLPAEVRAQVVELAAARQIAPSAEGLAPAGEGIAPVFGAGPVEASAALSERASGALPPGSSMRLAWRYTPAGGAPGPVPHPVLLVELGESTFAPEVVSYRLGAHLGRGGSPVSVEAYVASDDLPAYQRAALAAAGVKPSPVPRIRQDETSPSAPVGGVEPRPIHASGQAFESAQELESAQTTPAGLATVGVDGSHDAGSENGTAAVDRPRGPGSGLVPGQHHAAATEGSAPVVDPGSARPSSAPEPTAGPAVSTEPESGKPEHRRPERPSEAVGIPGSEPRGPVPAPPHGPAGGPSRPAPSPRPVMPALGTPVAHGEPVAGRPLRPMPSPARAESGLPGAGHAAPGSAEAPTSPQGRRRSGRSLSVVPPVPGQEQASGPRPAPVTRPTPVVPPAARPAPVRPWEAATADADTPVLASMHDPLSGPLSQPLLDAQLDRADTGPIAVVETDRAPAAREDATEERAADTAALPAGPEASSSAPPPPHADPRSDVATTAPAMAQVTPAIPDADIERGEPEPSSDDPTANVSGEDAVASSATVDAPTDAEPESTDSTTPVTTLRAPDQAWTRDWASGAWAMPAGGVGTRPEHASGSPGEAPDAPAAVEDDPFAADFPARLGDLLSEWRPASDTEPAADLGEPHQGPGDEHEPSDADEPSAPAVPEASDPTERESQASAPETHEDRVAARIGDPSSDISVEPEETPVQAEVPPTAGLVDEPGASTLLAPEDDADTTPAEALGSPGTADDEPRVDGPAEDPAALLGGLAPGRPREGGRRRRAEPDETATDGHEDRMPGPGRSEPGPSITEDRTHPAADGEHADPDPSVAADDPPTGRRAAVDGAPTVRPVVGGRRRSRHRPDEPGQDPWSFASELPRPSGEDGLPSPRPVPRTIPRVRRASAEDGPGGLFGPGEVPPARPDGPFGMGPRPGNPAPDDGPAGQPDVSSPEAVSSLSNREQELLRRLHEELAVREDLPDRRRNGS